MSKIIGLFQLPIFVAQLWSGKNACPPKWCALDDDIMSKSELSTSGIAT